MNRAQKLNRSQKRALERRGDRALARARLTFVQDPAREIAIVREDGDARVFDSARGRLVLEGLGLFGAFEQVEADRASRPGTLPVVVLVDDWASIAFVRVVPMTRGGDA